jgi:hypothetical protein
LQQFVESSCLGTSRFGSKNNALPGSDEDQMAVAKLREIKKLNQGSGTSPV